MANSDGIEALIRRLSTIEQAYHNRPDAPNYDHSEYMSGIMETADGSLVNPALVEYTAKKLKGDAEVMKETRKAAEAKAEANKGKHTGAGEAGNKK